VTEAFDLVPAQAIAACPDTRSAKSWGTAALIRQQKITFGEMRECGVCGILVYCSDYRCSHSTAITANHWPDDVRLSDIETRFTCQACCKRGADIRPKFRWQEEAARRTTISGRQASGPDQNQLR
jgi:hypothetical protein